MKNLIKSGLFAIGVFGFNMSVANEISADFLKTELERAHAAYLTGSVDTGLYALEALARLLESDQSAALQTEVGSNNLAFTYVRIGLLYEKTGNTSQAQAYFNKALGSYQGHKIEMASLKDSVLKLDNISS
ncbi:hypothetical protein [Rheinheimera sp.]|uniref:hypothetical protein n=1 Tax=Rheinheimera sp. TaxID=1869214 RepID=UPI00307F65FB